MAKKMHFDELAARVRQIRPHLEKRSWPPMSYMMIPSVLKSADELIAELLPHTDDPRGKELLEEIQALRADFRRE